MASTFKRGGKGNRGGKYYIAWVDHTGKRRTKSSGTTDKAAAERIAAKLEADAALRREGVIDAELDSIRRESHRSIESHLADFEAKMRAASRAPQHIASTFRYIRDVVEAAGFVTIADITADGVNRYACQLKEEGKAARTIEACLTALKGFTRWLTSHQKLLRDPLASVRKPNPKTDRRRERRMLLHEEWDWLRTTTAKARRRYGITGGERVLLYATAIQTGLRSSELRSLTRGRLFLDLNPPYITCKAGSTKSRKDARQYVNPHLAALLREHVATKSPQATVFAMPYASNVARMLHADLADARKAWLADVRHDPEERARREQSDFLAEKNHDGEVLDFHALRHTSGAWLARAGVHPKEIQAFMRHSVITLTMDVYGHLFPGQESETVNRFPDMLTEGPGTWRATGTDDAVAGDSRKGAQRQAQHTGSETLPLNAKGREREGDCMATGGGRKSLGLSKVRGAMREDARECHSVATKTRTWNRVIERHVHAAAVVRRRFCWET